MPPKKQKPPIAPVDQVPMTPKHAAIAAQATVRLEGNKPSSGRDSSRRGSMDSTDGSHRTRSGSDGDIRGSSATVAPETQPGSSAEGEAKAKVLPAEIKDPKDIARLELKDKIYWAPPPNSYGFFLSTFFSPMVRQRFRLVHAAALVVLTIICQAGLTVYLATFLDKDNSGECAAYLMEMICLSIFTATMYGNGTFMWTGQLCFFSAYMRRKAKNDSEEDRYYRVDKITKRERTALIMGTAGMEFFTWIWLLVCGCLFLHGSQDGESLLLNTVALEFIMNIDDVFFRIFVTEGGRERLQRCEFTVRIGHKDIGVNKAKAPSRPVTTNRAGRKGDKEESMDEKAMKKLEMQERIGCLQTVYDYFPLWAPCGVFGFAILIATLLRAGNYAGCAFEDNTA
eukprot:TRINITY_DN14822_c0_g1_i3.p1 TRINITY_DN14822_c0_g1~~TRINITY_DN14822_c0_g1_i3.p1  ORF type:complete len:397 (-),score=107.84 TRINITY_DN14822_c0_g1_i3:1170-2360(-)